MKICIIFLFLALVSDGAYSQSDSIRRYAKIQPLFQVIDSVARNLKQTGKSIDLVFYSSGHSLHSGIILWRNGVKHCGIYFRKEDRKELKKSSIAQRKIKSILSSRLFSDSCDLCQLANVKEKDRADHEYIMYLKRNIGSRCNEIYFLNSAYLSYDSESCIYDVREIVARKVSWPGKVSKKR